MTQTELATLLDVSFPTLNSWINNKSIPRQAAKEKIDDLYGKYTGQGNRPAKDFDKTYAGISTHKSLLQNPLTQILSRKDLYDHMCVRLTYHSDAIEGSTLTERETALVILENINLPNKTLIEQLEAKNHKSALVYLFEYLKSSEAIDEALIKKLHLILMNGIIDSAGNYRYHPVRIAGTNVITANYMKVPDLMRDLFLKMKKFDSESIEEIIQFTSHIHAQFEKIHPFADGNGRIGRLLMNAFLLEKCLAPAIIDKDKKMIYYTYLELAQEKDKYDFLELFVAESIIQGYESMQ